MINAKLALDWGLADLEARDGPEGEDVAAFFKPLLQVSPLVLRGIKSQTSAWRQGQAFAPRRAVERSNLLAT